MWHSKHRPPVFFGFDDYDESESWEDISARIERDQVEWDAQHKRLTFFQRIALVFSSDGIWIKKTGQ